MNTGKSVLRRISDGEATIQEDKRNFAARRMDRSRDALARDVEAYLAKGKKIQQVESYTEAPVRPRAHASDKNGSVT